MTTASQRIFLRRHLEAFTAMGDKKAAKIMAIRMGFAAGIGCKELAWNFQLTISRVYQIVNIDGQHRTAIKIAENRVKKAVRELRQAEGRYVAAVRRAQLYGAIDPVHMGRGPAQGLHFVEAA